jgi:hypothetical protein
MNRRSLCWSTSHKRFIVLDSWNKFQRGKLALLLCGVGVTVTVTVTVFFKHNAGRSTKTLVFRRRRGWRRGS